jgi:hypothetical protein
MMKLQASAISALLLFTAACAAPSAQHVPLPAQDVVVTSTNVARIYFVREETSGLRKSEIKVLDGSTEIGLLTTSTFLCWERPAGRTLMQAHYLSLDPGIGQVEGLLDLECTGGVAYYFNVVVRRENLSPVITRLDPEEGRKLVAERKWAGAN